MEDAIHFGPFMISPLRRCLLREGMAVPLGSRAVDILIFLVSHAGQLKTNDEIVRRVWPETHVEEANLRVHISALRKALGDTQRDPRFIANVPGRGYSFVAPVERSRTADAPPAAAGPAVAGRRLIGRGEAVASILRQFERGRLVTVTGPGGIGKTAVAAAVAGHYAAQGETVWIDLSEVGSGALVATVVATALGVVARSDTLFAELRSALAGRQALLVLDCCEHLVAAAAVFAETMLAAVPDLRILTTSREPLRIGGERVLRLLPLDLAGDGADVAAALASPAVRLFVERADECLGGYELSEADMPHVCRICRRLDGIALAIELAAGRLESVSIAALARSLESSFHLIGHGRRTALPRHQTLRATLDWSYQLLSPREQQALRQLSVIRGAFTEEAARTILGRADNEDLLASLVAKSLVVMETRGRTTTYRLLDATRHYAEEKLDAADERAAVLGRFSEHLIRRLEAAETDLYSGTMDAWPDDVSVDIPGLRVALGWLLDGGDPATGVRLTVAALPLFFRLSLLDECLDAVVRSIALLDRSPGLDEVRRMKLHAAMGWPQLRAAKAPEWGIQAWTTALRIAEDIGDLDHQLRAVWALWVDAINRAQPVLGVALADRFSRLAGGSGDAADRLIGRRMQAANLHWLGRHAEARDRLLAMLADYDLLPDGWHAVRFQFDQRVTARVILARCLWMLGEEEGALREVEETLCYADRIRHDLSSAVVLAEAACPLALMSGRFDLARTYVDLLRDHTRMLSLDIWNAYADCFEAELRLRRDRAPGEALRQLRRSMALLRNAGFTLFETQFRAIEADSLSELGRHDEAAEVLDAALRQCARTGERWCLPEIGRMQGVVARRRAPGGMTEAARSSFRAALAAAAEDGAVGWARRIEREIAAA